MKVRLEKTFPMPASAETGWTLLQDIPGVAGCMPGAKISEQVDATHYKGTVAVKFGPASLSFRGEVEVLALEAESKTLRLVGKGTDTTGSSAAGLDLTARVEAVDGSSCNLVGNSEVSMSGKAATFGGRMAGAVADQVLKQFAANFASKVQAMQAANRAEPPPPAPATPVSDTAPVAASVASPGTAPPPAVAAPPSAPTSAPPFAPPPAPPVMVTSPPAELDGLALAWGMLKDWLRGLFAAKRT